MSRTGLAFSGGGIRSAAFCSGVLRRLLHREAKIDCLSCVSGGGYTGTAYLDWKYRHGKKDDPKWHQEFFNYMRSRAGYLCNWQNPIAAVADSLLIIALIILVSLIIPIIIWLSFACPVAYVVDFLVGDLLRAEGCAESLAGHETVHEAVHDEECEVAGDAYIKIVLFSSLLVIAVLSFALKDLTTHGKFLFQFISISALTILALLFFPWAIHAFLEGTPVWAQGMILVLAAIIWFSFPVFRQQASMIMVLYVYAFIIHVRVYKHSLLGLEYSGYTFNILVWVSAIVLALVPYIGSIQQRLMQVFHRLSQRGDVASDKFCVHIRWRLQKAFYTLESVGITGCSGIGCHDLLIGYPRLRSTSVYTPLSVADLEDVSPFYISNTTTNSWKRTPKDKESFGLLTITPREIRRLDAPYDEDVFLGKLEPEHVKLSEAMATSAAALSQYMGKNSGSDVFTDTRILLGVAFGSTISSDPHGDQRQNFCLQLVPGLIVFIQVLPMIAFPLVYFVDGDEKWVTIGVFSYFGILLLFSIIANYPTGSAKPGLLEKITRWFVVHIPYIRYVRSMLGIINEGPSPPPIMYISDGGHYENLGLLPLLKLRLPKIVIVNGGFCESDEAYGVDLNLALKLAREELRCSFSGVDGRDVMEDIRANFVEKKPGDQPRSYRFKVTYYSQDPEAGVEKAVGEGQILFIAPRHPSKGVQTKEPMTWKETLDDIDVDLEAGHWGTGPELDADEVDRLTFCCCEACHSLHCQPVSRYCCGSFPLHSTANQFFTPAMFSAYHREGYRAAMEAQAVEFLSG